MLETAVLKPVYGFEEESDQKWMRYSKWGHSAGLQNSMIFLMLSFFTVLCYLNTADSSGT